SSRATPTPVGAVHVDVGRLPTAASIATELTTVEGLLAAPSTPAGKLDSLARRQQLVYLVLSVHPAWQATGLATVPAALQPVVSANLTAGADLSNLTGVVSQIPS